MQRSWWNRALDVYLGWEQTIQTTQQEREEKCTRFKAKLKKVSWEQPTNFGKSPNNLFWLKSKYESAGNKSNVSWEKLPTKLLECKSNFWRDVMFLNDHMAADIMLLLKSSTWRFVKLTNEGIATIRFDWRHTVRNCVNVAIPFGMLVNLFEATFKVSRLVKLEMQLGKAVIWFEAKLKYWSDCVSQNRSSSLACDDHRTMNNNNQSKQNRKGKAKKPTMRITPFAITEAKDVPRGCQSHTVQPLLICCQCQNRFPANL